MLTGQFHGIGQQHRVIDNDALLGEHRCQCIRQLLLVLYQKNSHPRLALHLLFIHAERCGSIARDEMKAGNVAAIIAPYPWKRPRI
jgi:hypothetical protein